MKPLITLLFILLAAPAAYCGESLTQYETEIIKGLAKVEVLTRTSSNAVWPGYSPFFIPTMVQFWRQGRSINILFNHPNPPAEYKPVSDICKACVPRHYPGTMVWGTQDSPGQQSFRWETINGVDTHVFMNQGSTIYYFIGFLVHENFHVFQTKNFKQTGPYKNQENISPDLLADAYQERLLLAQALYSKNWKHYLTQFLTFRKARYLQDAGIADLESAQERSEGTAAYVEHKAVSFLQSNTKSAAFLKHHIAASLFYHVLPYFKPPFYGSGAAQCVLLDELGVDWKTKVQAGLSLFEAFPVAEQSAKLTGSVQYQRRQLLNLAAGEAGWYELVRKAKLDSFNNINGLKLKLKFTTKSPIATTFSGSSQLLPVGLSDYLVTIAHMKIQYKQALTLLIQNSPVIFHGNTLAGGKPDTYSYYYEIRISGNSTKVLMDGTPLQILQKISSFKTAEITSENVTLRATANGSCRMRGNEITLDLGELK